MGKNKNRDTLEKALTEVISQGIDVDKEKLKKDMCAQFPDHRLYIREYVTNAYDAGANQCRIFGIEEEKTISISIEDDGCGMDRKGVMDFATIFRSVKRGNRNAIGTYGIGKLSVAAIPGQISYKMTSSTGKEAWRLDAGCLIDNSPIRIERIEPLPDRGTSFEITFEKNSSLPEELNLLADVLQRYVKFLPIRIYIFELKMDSSGIPEQVRWVPYATADWTCDRERFPRQYQFSFNGQPFEVVLGLDMAVHEIYQKRVFISDNYDLVASGLSDVQKIPHLKIRVDSPAFELPFGRHRLQNEALLEPLSRYLRNQILPQFIEELINIYESSALSIHAISPDEVEAIACALMAFDTHPHYPWCNVPVFKVVNAPRISLTEMVQLSKLHGRLYLAEADYEPTDAAAFDAPVLSRHQPEGGLGILMNLLKERLVDLSGQDVALLAPIGSAPKLGKKELRFQEALRFNPLSQVLEEVRNSARSSFGDMPSSHNPIVPQSGIDHDEKTGIDHYEQIATWTWRLGHLVNKDGQTACRKKRFLVDRASVVLNLYHKEVDLLLKLSEKAPALAAHWAVCMCLTEGNLLMSHLSDETREDLLMLDAMARCDGKTIDGKKRASRTGKSRAYREFLRNIDAFDPPF
jgi:hypothetical protein